MLNPYLDNLAISTDTSISSVNPPPISTEATPSNLSNLCLKLSSANDCKLDRLPLVDKAICTIGMEFGSILITIGCVASSGKAPLTKSTFSLISNVAKSIFVPVLN